MKFNAKKPNVIMSISQFLTSELLQEEIQKLPKDLQEIIDMVFDTPYGNDIETRRKILRCKKIIAEFAKSLEPFTEDEIQKTCEDYINFKRN
jgi:hypothetical protein